MSSEFLITFGDVATTFKGLPSIAKGTEVQIAGVGFHNGKLCYTAAVFDSMGNFVSVVGPYPHHAFLFSRHCTASELTQLFKHLTKE